MFLDIHAAFDINIKHDILTSVALVFYLLFQGAVKTVLVNFLILQKLMTTDALTEFLWTQKEIFHPVALCAAGSPAGATDREIEPKLRMTIHQPLYNGGFAAATGS